MKIALNKNADDNVIALINAANDANWLSGQVTFGVPADYSDAAGRNTKLDATFWLGGTPRKTHEIHYKRRGLLDNVQYPVTSFETYDGMTDTELLALVAPGLGVLLSEIEFTTTFNPDLPYISVRPKTGSLLYKGFPVRVDLAKRIPDASLLFTQQLLNGFDAATS